MFMSALVLREAPERDMWILAEPLVWVAAKRTSWRDTAPGFTVPAGFMTDLASIPRVARNLPAFDPNGVSRKAAVGHDWKYWLQSGTKDEADLFLREAMLAEGCTYLEADAFYAAVKWFGQSSWDDATKLGLASHFETPAAYNAYVATIPAVQRAMQLAP